MGFWNLWTDISTVISRRKKCDWNIQLYKQFNRFDIKHHYYYNDIEIS